jgi:preprotein translocase subunit SecD
MLARNAVELAFPGGESLTNVDIEGAKVVRSDFDNLPTVFATFTDSGKARFCELSGQYVGKPVAIRVDDTELSAPVIFEAICGGQIQITLGHSVDQAETEREAVALAAALDTPVLGSSWVIALIAVGSP